MLVLTRRLREEIVIGDVIRVKIISIHNQRVKVGITAPSRVTVHRVEVHQRRQEFHDCPGVAEQNEDAAASEQRNRKTTASRSTAPGNPGKATKIVPEE